MNTEIMNIFRSVLKEELDPVHKRLGVIEQNVKEIKTGQKKLENDVSELKNDVNGLKTGQKKLENDFSQLDQAVRELSAEQKEGHKCVIRYLEDYSEKITNHFDNKTDALNKRVFTVETEIERLIKQ
jgi:chromosome segregation ATPase